MQKECDAIIARDGMEDASGAQCSSGDADPSAGVGPLRCAETWIAGLLQGHFFHSCHAHLLRRKCETTFFCTDCCSLPLCIHCLDDHRHHHVIQVRKYVYCDVVRTQDVQRYVDLSGVQTYIINGARVAFLNPNPRRRAVKGPTTCVECRAATREGCNYCSLACRVVTLARAGVPLRPPVDISSCDEAEDIVAPPSKRFRTCPTPDGGPNPHFLRSARAPVVRPAPPLRPPAAGPPLTPSPLRRSPPPRAPPPPAWAAPTPGRRASGWAPTPGRGPPCPAGASSSRPTAAPRPSGRRCSETRHSLTV